MCGPAVRIVDCCVLTLTDIVLSVLVSEATTALPSPLYNCIIIIIIITIIIVVIVLYDRYVDRERTEELLRQQSEADDNYSYIDVEPCNSYLRKLTYQRLEHRYVSAVNHSPLAVYIYVCLSTTQTAISLFYTASRPSSLRLCLLARVGHSSVDHTTLLYCTVLSVSVLV